MQTQARNSQRPLPAQHLASLRKGWAEGGAQEVEIFVFLVTWSYKWQPVTFAHIQGEGTIEWPECKEVGSLEPILFIYLFIGAHFKGCPPHPEFRCCSCLLYLTRMDRSRREGGVFEKQNPTGLNILFAITYDIVSHTLWYLSHYYSFAHLFFHSLRSMQHVTHENAVWHVTFLTPRCGLPKISGKSFFLS